MLMAIIMLLFTGILCILYSTLRIATVKCKTIKPVIYVVCLCYVEYEDRSAGRVMQN